MQSAIGMDDDHFLINADPSEEVLGNDITVSFSATGEKEDQTTFFSIAIESEENAHLSDEYLFNESGIAEILTTDNQKLALHRLDDSDSSSTDYWFSLDGTNKVDFELNFSSFEGESEDPLHTLAIYTSIGETLDVSRNKIIKLKKTESIRLSLTWLNEIVPTEVTDKVDETESGEEPDKMDKANDSTEEPTLPNASEPPAVPASKGNVSSTNLSTPGEVILALDQNTFSFKGNSIDKNPEAKITGPAPTHDKVEKAYGYLAAYDGTTETWVEVEGSEFSDSRAIDIKYRFNKNTLTLDELLHTRYSFFVGSARIDGVDKTLNPPARSDVFYLADLFKIGFRDWAVDYYPDAHNNGIAIKNISELATAYKIYKNYTLNITATPNSVTYQAGENATLDFIISSPDHDLKKDTYVYIDLQDSLGDAIPTDGTLVISSGDVKKNTSPDHLITLKVTKDIIKGRTFGFNYTYQLPYGSKPGDHQIEAFVNSGSQYGVTETSYEVTPVTEGWHIVDVSSNTDTPYPGDEVIYTVDIKNFGNSPITLDNFKATIGGIVFDEQTNLNKEIQPDDTITIPVTIKTNGLTSGVNTVELTVTDSNSVSETLSKELIMIETSFSLKPSIAVTNGVVSAKLTSTTLRATPASQLWQYRDGNGEWINGTGTTTNTNQVVTYSLPMNEIDALKALTDSATRQYRAVLTNANGKKEYSNPVYFAEINDLIKMATIDSGTDFDLSLETLSTYYYDEVAKDPTKPFSDAATFTKLLLEAYDAGGTSQLEKVYYKHIYDLKDPNLLARHRSFDEGESQSYPYNQYDKATDHGDRNFQWGKDNAGDNSSPFHNIVSSIIHPMDAVLQDGVLLTGSGFIDLEKKAQAYLDGDTNTERKYTVDIKATENGTEAAPTVIVFQVQTSWQMFSLEHANGKNGKVGPAKVDITDMATLYDIKHAMIDFAKWVKVNGDGTVVFAVTDVEHAGTFSAISDPYLTNDMDSLITALEGWDIFGNCEHVHYTSDALKNALEAVNSTDLAGWVDKNGTPILDSAEKVGVIIGGTTENKDGINGYSAVFPAVAGIDTYHTIETVSGQVLDGRPRLSWLDTPANIDTVRNSGGTQYKDVTTREALVETFKDIMNQSTAKKGAAEDTIIEDTIQSEFDYVPGSVKIVRTDESGTEDVTAIADDDPNLVFSLDESGNQVISYQFGTVEYGSKINLRFDLQAKDDYIGSNNVYTNIGVPNLSYVTDLSEPTSQDYTDTPKVNVPIRFPIVDGSEAIVRLGTDVGLKTDERLKASDIVAGIEDYVDNYSQINGDVTYQWELLETDGNGEILYETDENGEIITEQIHETDDKGQIVFEKDTEGNIIYDQVDGKNIPRAIFTEMKLPKISTTLVYDARTGTITDSSGNLPLYNDTFKADALGRYPFRLKVNFAPNDAEEESGVQVGSLTKSGNVTVIVEEVEVMPLPKTGGPGHQIYLMLGLILTIGSGITILNRQKKT